MFETFSSIYGYRKEVKLWQQTTTMTTSDPATRYNLPSSVATRRCQVHPCQHHSKSIYYTPYLLNGDPKAFPPRLRLIRVLFCHSASQRIRLNFVLSHYDISKDNLKKFRNPKTVCAEEIQRHTLFIRFSSGSHSVFSFQQPLPYRYEN